MFITAICVSIINNFVLPFKVIPLARLDRQYLRVGRIEQFWGEHVKLLSLLRFYEGERFLFAYRT